MNAFRSLLFVPGARPDRFAKAAASGADAVCIDLEDAVAPHLKDEARDAALAYLKTPDDGAAFGVRINGLDTEMAKHDLDALASQKARPSFVMIPKAAGAKDMGDVRAALGGHCPPLWSLIETPEGLLVAPEIARAVGEQGGLMFGGADYSATIGSDMSWDALLFARGSIVNAAAIAGCATMDVPYLDVKDETGMAAETARVKAMGFTGRACIHPAQVPAINRIFTPSEDELSKAERIKSAYDAAEGGVALLDGKLIEKPVLRAAQRVLDCRRD